MNQYIKKACYNLISHNKVYMLFLCFVNFIIYILFFLHFVVKFHYFHFLFSLRLFFNVTNFSGDSGARLHDACAARFSLNA